MNTKECGQLTSNDTAEGVYYCGPVKTSHNGFYLATLEKLMKDWPGGSYLVMEITPRVPVGRPILNIGYKYNSRKVLGFISAEGAGSTEPDDPYLSHFPVHFSNVSVHPIVRPRLLCRYFNACNAIQSQQDASVLSSARGILDHTEWIFYTCNYSGIVYGCYR